MTTLLSGNKKSNEGSRPWTKVHIHPSIHQDYQNYRGNQKLCCLDIFNSYRTEVTSVTNITKISYNFFKQTSWHVSSHYCNCCTEQTSMKCKINPTSRICEGVESEGSVSLSAQKTHRHISKRNFFRQEQ